MIYGAPMIYGALWAVESALGHYLLWGALGLLLLAPAILSRTRWSESRPIVVCVGLSVFAHLLLMIYAYATRLPYTEFLKPGDGEGGDAVVALNLLDEGEEGDEPSDADARDAHLRDAGDTLDAGDNAEQMIPMGLLDIPAGPESAEDEQTALPAEEPAPQGVDPTNDAASPETPSPTAPPLTVAALPLMTPPDAQATAPPPASPDAPEVNTPDAMPREVEPTTEIPAEAFVSAPVPEPLFAPVDGDAAPRNDSIAAATPAPTPTPRGALIEVAPVRPLDGRPLPAPYRNRQADRRLEIAQQHGGNVNTEAAVRDALQWLALQQSTDGRWVAAAFGAGRESRVAGQDRGGAGAHADTGLTGLALLSFLGAGETHLAGPHREQIQRGLEFLLRSQRPDGELGGSAELFARMYCHGMATLALSEALSMTGDDRIRPFLERAVNFTVRAQDPVTGGWRYRPGDSGDTSQFGWQLMSLKSAQLAGVHVPPATWTNAQRFLQTVTSGSQQGLASYRPGERPSRTMTAEALVCRILLDSHREPQIREALGFVLQELPRAESENHYYWYYGTLALFQTQGDGWPVWNDALQRQLLARQRQDGGSKGSWDPDPVWGPHGGRVFSTAMATLCLEVYYRYLPLYQTASAPERGASR